MTGRRAYSRTGLRLERQRQWAALPPTQRWLRRIPAIAILSALLLILLAIFGLGPGLLAFDRAHFTTTVCTVTSAERTSTSSASGRVASSSGPFVQVKTRDCGTLWLRWMIGEDNVDAKVAALDHVGRVRFKIGEGSLNLMPIAMQLPRSHTTVYDFTRLN